MSTTDQTKPCFWQLGARRRGVRAVFVPTCVICFISATQTEFTAAFSRVLSQGPPVLHTWLLFYYLGWNSSIRKRGHFIIHSFLFFFRALLNHRFQQSSPDSLHRVSQPLPCHSHGVTEGRKSEILKGLNHAGGSPASSEGALGAHFLVLILLV